MPVGIAILMIVVGVILRYATNFRLDISLVTVGLALIVAGVVGLAFNLLQELVWSRVTRHREPGWRRG